MNKIRIRQAYWIIPIINIDDDNVDVDVEMANNGHYNDDDDENGTGHYTISIVWNCQSVFTFFDHEI